MVRLIREEEAPRPSVQAQQLQQPAEDRGRTQDRAGTAVEAGPRRDRLDRDEVPGEGPVAALRDGQRRWPATWSVTWPTSPWRRVRRVSSYRLRKFARKYKKALATAAAFAVLLVAGVVMSTSLAVWATSAEDAERGEPAAIASEAAKQEAVEAKAEADKQRDEARLTAYASGMGLAQRAWEENNVVRARELLEEVPKEAAGRDLRGFEWYYLSRLCHPDELTLKGHAGVVKSVAFSPDGQRLASGSGDKTVKIWDSATGKELFSLKGHAGAVYERGVQPGRPAPGVGEL